jgi:hypothetical protein
MGIVFKKAMVVCSAVGMFYGGYTVMSSGVDAIQTAKVKAVMAEARASGPADIPVAVNAN